MTDASDEESMRLAAQTVVPSAEMPTLTAHIVSLAWTPRHQEPWYTESGTVPDWAILG